MRKILIAFLAISSVFAISTKKVYNVEGMMCGVGCVNTINSTLKNLDGIKEIYVDFENKSMEVVFDDFFVPYCHTTTYAMLINDARKLGLVPISEIPDLKQLYSLDNIPLRVGFEKKENKKNTNSKFKFTKQVDEFTAKVPSYISESIILSKKVIKCLKKLDNPYITSSFCLSLFRIRAQTCNMSNPKVKHQMLQSHLEMILLNTTKNISSFYDAQKYYG